MSLRKGPDSFKWVVSLRRSLGLLPCQAPRGWSPRGGGGGLGALGEGGVIIFYCKEIKWRIRKYLPNNQNTQVKRKKKKTRRDIYWKEIVQQINQKVHWIHIANDKKSWINAALTIYVCPINFPFNYIFKIKSFFKQSFKIK